MSSECALVTSDAYRDVIVGPLSQFLTARDKATMQLVCRRWERCVPGVTVLRLTNTKLRKLYDGTKVIARRDKIARVEYHSQNDDDNDAGDDDNNYTTIQLGGKPLDLDFPLATDLLLFAQIVDAKRAQVMCHLVKACPNAAIEIIMHFAPTHSLSGMGTLWGVLPGQERNSAARAIELGLFATLASGTRNPITLAIDLSELSRLSDSGKLGAFVDAVVGTVDVVRICHECEFFDMYDVQDFGIFGMSPSVLDVPCSHLDWFANRCLQKLGHTKRSLAIQHKPFKGRRVVALGPSGELCILETPHVSDLVALGDRFLRIHVQPTGVSFLASRNVLDLVQVRADRERHLREAKQCILLYEPRWPMFRIPDPIRTTTLIVRAEEFDGLIRSPEWSHMDISVSRSLIVTGKTPISRCIFYLHKIGQGLFTDFAGRAVIFHTVSANADNECSGKDSETDVGRLIRIMGECARGEGPRFPFSVHIVSLSINGEQYTGPLS